jgi:hypothetical protein
VSDAPLPPDGRLVGAPDVLAALASIGVGRVADVLARGTCVRDLPERSNWELAAGDLRLFGKLTKRRGWLRRVPARPPEAAGLLRLKAVDVPCARIAAVGRDAALGALTLTHDLAPLVPLDDLLAGGLAPHPRDRLLAALARLAARLHDARLHHADLYLNHVYADAATGRLALIDAERVASHRGLLGRAVVKDLAALDSSLPASLGAHARGRLLLRYLLARGLPARGLAAPLGRRIARKSARIRAHLPRTPVGAAARPRTAPVSR